MKKFLPFILIVLVFVQLFLPFSTSIKKGDFRLDKNTTEAAFFVVTHQDGSTEYLPRVGFGGNVGNATMAQCQTEEAAYVPTNGSRITASCVDSTPSNYRQNQIDAEAAKRMAERNQRDTLACTTGSGLAIEIHVGACFAQGLYYLFFKTTSFVFMLAGKTMDLGLNYSLQDTSYRSIFVAEGWGVVRDFCNMFFIFIMLYIAIGTILNLHSVKTKEMIIDVIIIGLLINFSLFATRLVIDVSNILARVFYNPQTIITGTQREKGITAEPGEFGEIQLSSAIVSKVDPQVLITSATSIENIPTKSIDALESSNTTPKVGGISVGTFIILIFVATAVNVVGTIVFLSCALVFIGRVVMLWVAMILSPLAFFSYTVPSMRNFEMIGWSKWWSDTLKMAFVAPIFDFFMYIIVGFMDKGLGVVNATLKGGFNNSISSFLGVIVPFIFVVILLLQAKKIAVKMSGSVGETLSKAGAAVGGLALGAATGGAAMAMRNTVGKLGNKIGESEWAKNNGRFGRMVGDVGKWTATKSFDIRNTSAGKSAMKEMGVEGSAVKIKPKEGGYKRYKEDVEKKRIERAKSLEAGENSHAVHGLHEKEEALQSLKNKNAKVIDEINRNADAKRIEANEKSAIATSAEALANKKDASEEEKTQAKKARQDAQDAWAKLREFTEAKKAIEKGEEFTDSEGKIYKGEKIAVSIDENHIKRFEDKVADAESILNKAVEDREKNIKKAKEEGKENVTKVKLEQGTLEQEAKKEEERAKEVYNKADPQHQKEAMEAWDRAKQKTAETVKNAADAVARAEEEANNKIADVDTDIANKQQNVQKASSELKDIKDKKERGVKEERSMFELEKQDIPDSKFEISRINSERKNKYADEIEKRFYNKKANRHAAHQIRMGVEIKSEGKH